jgi:2-dehydropantoate 2-reductase
LAVKSTDYFKNASLNYLVDTIEETMGEIYFHFCFGFSHILFKSKYREIINSRSSRAIYVELLNEITMLAAVKLSLPNDIVMQTIHKLEKTKRSNFIDASGRFGWSKI